jgi:endonuclease/exonuclease/phosphatase (EEP) superfamily protein YafD
VSRRRFVATIATAGFALAFAAWLTAPLGWPMELARHFTLHLALAGAVITLALGLQRRLRLAGGSAIGAAVLTWAFLAAPFAPTDHDHEGDTITLAVFNARYDREAMARFADWAGGRGVDIIMLAEAHGVPFDELEALYARWPYGMTSHGDVTLPGLVYTTRIAVFSRQPLEAHAHAGGPGRGAFNRPLLLITADTRLGPLHLTAMHPFPPILPGAARTQREMFQAVADQVPGDGRFVVLGDFNSTVWSPVFHALPGRRAGDPRFATTFPALTQFGGITIDHILIGDALSVVHYEVGPDLGSDHRPVLAVIGAR